MNIGVVIFVLWFMFVMRVFFMNYVEFGGKYKVFMGNCNIVEVKGKGTMYI